MILVDPASKLIMAQTAVHQQPPDPAPFAAPFALWFAVLEQLGKR
jgi:hypothetical protein